MAIRSSSGTIEVHSEAGEPARPAEVVIHIRSSSTSSFFDVGSGQDSSSLKLKNVPLRTGDPAAPPPTSYNRARDEISRILAVQSNFYAVLQVTKQSNAADIRNSFLKHSRLVHPDKCSDPRAHHATALLNRAHGTLKNPVKKALYDRFVTDYASPSTKGVSYDEWEATIGSQQVVLPAWMLKVLGCPGGSLCLLLLLLGLLPMALLALLLLGGAMLLFLPIRLGMRLWHQHSAPRRSRSFVGVRVVSPTHMPLYPKAPFQQMEQELLPLPQRGGTGSVVSCSDTRSSLMSPRKQSASGAPAAQDSTESV